MTEESAAPERFELWRQDDNGQRFLVGVFEDLITAEARMAELTRCLHKQMYWIVTVRTLEENRSVPG